MSWLNRYTAAAAAAVATVGLWTAIGFPTPVLSSDLQKLENRIGRIEAGQLDTAIRVFEDQMDRLIIRKGTMESEGLPPFNPSIRSLERQIESLSQDLRDARQRRIELAR